MALESQALLGWNLTYELGRATLSKLFHLPEVQFLQLNDMIKSTSQDCHRRPDMQ